MSEKKAKKSIMPVVITGIAAIIIIALVLVIFFLIKELNKQEPAISSSTQGNLIVDESNLEGIENQLKDSVKDGMFQVNMNTTWHFKEGNGTSENAYVSNASANHYPITFEVYLKGEEKIYSSTLMPVGTQLKELTLDKELSKGKYDAVCKYYLWNEKKEEVGSLGVNVIIIVE